MKYYRVRRTTKGGVTVLVGDNIADIESVYRVILDDSKGKPKRVYHIDMIDVKLFSKVPAFLAKKRLEEIRDKKNTFMYDTYDDCYYKGKYVDQDCNNCPYKEVCSGSKEDEEDE